MQSCFITFYPKCCISSKTAQKWRWIVGGHCADFVGITYVFLRELICRYDTNGKYGLILKYYMVFPLINE
jgi:hypothetical protein